ncbi:DNA adenine methylase [Paracoccus lutimaris]|uniref:DNA adenine methylase n=1 Tax=Paracoccus lutimaris TaxID=1490030 RepID=A0A368Z054_9RHOB|nr:DNA adenine methylase [Paracoccus lutimaris]RCW84866.1 DNA adenine methylase [Paracoccus lutimaris]
MTAPTRPILRWHGGKWLLAPWIISHMPAHRVYVEPFGGAASVLLRKPRTNLEVWNDLDGELVALFHLLRTAPDNLARLIEATPFARAEFDVAQSGEPCADDVEQVRRLLIRSHMGFSPCGAAFRGGHSKTGFRGRGVRAGTTPPMNWMGMPAVIASVADRMRGVVIESRPALELIAAHDSPDTLFYVDPPYLPETRDAGGDYRHEMTGDDHMALLDVLRAVRGKVILSGYPSPVYDAALAGWNRIEKTTHADGARKRTEVIWRSFEQQGTLI